MKLFVFGNGLEELLELDRAAIRQRALKHRAEFLEKVAEAGLDPSLFEGLADHWWSLGVVA